MEHLQQLKDFYLTPDATGSNIFDIWESGGSRGDSITPSTGSAEYQNYIVTKLDRLLHAGGEGALLSLGSGNAVVEQMLQKMGHDVFAVDVLEHAVGLALSKGIEAVCADIGLWRPVPRPWRVVYADGLLGHFYDPGTGQLDVLENIRTFSSIGFELVISNDQPPDGQMLAPAPGVPGFHWLSGDMIAAELTRAGYQVIEVTEFTYLRPLSGARRRAIVTAQVEGTT